MGQNLYCQKEQEAAYGAHLGLELAAQKSLISEIRDERLESRIPLSEIMEERMGRRLRLPPVWACTIVFRVSTGCKHRLTTPPANAPAPAFWPIRKFHFAAADSTAGAAAD